MRRLRIFILLLLYPVLCFSMDNLFYILHTSADTTDTAKHIPYASLDKHYHAIDILVAQSYQIDETGKISGKVDPDVLHFAKSHEMKLMVLVTNRMFDREKAHRFLNNKAAQQKSINALVNECKQHHFYGAQIDFENISIHDRGQLTQYFQQIADQLHQHGFIVSFSVVPLVAADAPPTEYLTRVKNNWAGAYDLKALSRFSDFISIMAYDQHSEGTPPGPAASYKWMEEAVKHALLYMPADKISLGIPNYSQYWYMASNANKAKRLVVRRDQVSYQTAHSIVDKAHAKLRWDDAERIKYAFYERNWLNEYVYMEDAQSFKNKLEIVKKYQLRGISVFTLGLEDPKIWRVLEA